MSSFPITYSFKVSTLQSFTRHHLNSSPSKLYQHQFYRSEEATLHHDHLLWRSLWFQGAHPATWCVIWASLTISSRRMRLTGPTENKDRLIREIDYNCSIKLDASNSLSSCHLFLLEGSAVFKSLMPALFSSIIYIILFEFIKLNEDGNEIFGHPYPMGALVSAFTFLLAFR
jgi:hypothetical protein